MGCLSKQGIDGEWHQQQGRLQQWCQKSLLHRPQTQTQTSKSMQITSTRCKTGWSSLGQMQCGTKTDAASFVKSVAVGTLTLTAAKEVTCVAKELTCLTHGRRQPDAQKEDSQNKHLQRFVSCLAIQHDDHHHPAPSKTNVKHVQGK